MLPFLRKQREKPKFELDEFFSLLDESRTEEAVWYFIQHRRQDMWATLNRMNSNFNIYFDEIIEKTVREEINRFQRDPAYMPGSFLGGMKNRLWQRYTSLLPRIKAQQEKLSTIDETLINISEPEKQEEPSNILVLKEIMSLVNLAFLQFSQNCANVETNNIPNNRGACLCHELLTKVEFKPIIVNRQKREIKPQTPEGRLIEIRNMLTAFKNLEQAEMNNFKFTYTRFKEIYGLNTPENKKVDEWLRQRVHRCYEDFVDIYNELKKIRKND